MMKNITMKPIKYDTILMLLKSVQKENKKSWLFAQQQHTLNMSDRDLDDILDGMKYFSI